MNDHSVRNPGRMRGSEENCFACERGGSPHPPRQSRRRRGGCGEPPRNTQVAPVSRRGVALVLVVFAIAFICVLAVAMLDEATIDLAILRNHTSGLRALYAAQAGVSEAIVALREQYDTTNAVSGNLTLPGGATATFSAEIDNNEPVVTVTSTGQADGFTRQVVARLVVGQPDACGVPYPVRVVWWREGT